MTVTHGFELIEEREIPELKTRARWFRHVRTGAELLSLENDDENKVFGITFRTPPASSNGLPHIMEHSVLCGSQKYPLKEPFVELIKGSLKTFVNAMTYPDKTVYPVASQNLQDLYNLIDVYMDAVLHPLIPPIVLKQEGWHYELDDPQEPLSYKGVVFNEMKGAYSSPDNVLGRYSQQAVFPDNTYGVDSGGDPRHIPDLTYEEFKRFHEKHYHPSNARIVFYGDDDPEERLRRLDGYLQEFDRIDVDASVELQPRFAEPRRLSFPYAVDESGNGKKSYVTLNWMLDEKEDRETTLGLRILTHILIGTPASPLRKALIDSGLGEDLTGGGLEDDLRQMMFSTGLKGIAGDDADKVEKLALETLEKLANDGIDPDMIAASVNTVEFRLRENNTGSYPRGLALMIRSLSTWLYGGDPIDPLMFESPLEAIKERLAAGERYFESLIRRYLLDNPHRAQVLLKPDPTLAQEMEAEEKQRLADVRAGLSEDELNRIVEETRELKQHQQTPDSPEVLASIPSLTLEDLDREVKRIPLDVQRAQDTPVLFHDLFTNGIVYLDLGFNLHALPQDFIPYVSLFGRSLLELGTDREDYVKLSQRIGRSTGGIRTAALTSAVHGQEQSVAWMFLRGKSTMAQAGDLLDILRDVLLKARFDNRERFRQMVLEEKADMEAGLIPAGHRFVNSRLRSFYHEADWASEQMGGVEYLFFLRRLAEEVDKNWPAVVDRLEGMRSRLLNRQVMLCNITLDSENWTALQPRLSEFLAGLPAAPANLAKWQPEVQPGSEGLTIPAQVNYVGEGANLYDLGYTMDGSISVINMYLRTTWLWERIRVQGGAYGGFSGFDHRTGVYTFFSYRDPNLLGTLENYRQTGDFLRRLELNPDELTKTIIGAIGEMDAYQLPDAKGFTSLVRYLVKEDDKFRQRVREQILSTTVEDFHALGEVLNRIPEQSSVVVLGSADAIQAANEQKPGFLDVKKVM